MIGEFTAIPYKEELLNVNLSQRICYALSVHKLGFDYLFFWLEAKSEF